MTRPSPRRLRGPSPSTARPRRAGRTIVATALAVALGGGTPAAGAQRFEVLPVPSTQGNIDPALNRLNDTDQLRSTVLLPDGYDEQPGRRWPVLYLLHGAEDNASTWREPVNGDVARVAAGLPAIVVMPEGGRGYYTDHWLGGSRRGANWERYFLDEVIPTMESRYRISPDRDDHAIAGPSMGGLGAVLFAAELPSYFGTTIALSGLLDLENPATQYILPPVSRISYPRYWGRYGGQYAKGHSPNQLLGNLTQSRLRLTAGNGFVDPRIPSDAKASILGGILEGAVRISSFDTYRRARSLGVPVTLSTHVGIHDWPFWRADLRRAIAWGLFDGRPTGDADPTRFSYRTIAARGNAWGLGYRFAVPPTRIMDLRRSGQQVEATGAGTLTVTPGAAPGDASGTGTRTECTFTAKLPFRHTLPPGC